MSRAALYSPPSETSPPSASKPDENPFSKFSYRPSHAAQKQRQDTHITKEDDWMEARSPIKMTDWEKRRNAQKAMVKQISKENYRKNKEFMTNIRKRSREAADDVDDDDYDNIIVEKKKNDMRKICGKSNLIKNSLLEKDIDDYDPLDDYRSKNSVHRKMSVYERLNRVESSNSNTGASNANMMPRVNFKPFKSPSITTEKKKTKMNVENFVIDNVSSKKSDQRRRKIVLSDDEEEEGSVQQNTQHKSSELIDITLESSDDNDVQIIKPMKKKPSKNSTKDVKAKKTKLKRVQSSEEEDSHPDSDNENNSSSAEEDEELDQNQLQDRMSNIIQQCESVSKRLQDALLKWENKKSNSGEKDCINLISIDDEAKNGENARTLIADDDMLKINSALKLNGYQLVGVNWLKLLYENDVNGVLADDMGLGKTVQTIAFLSWLNHSTNGQRKSLLPHLIVVPASTLNNWKNEIGKFNSKLRLFIYHGSQQERSQLRYELKVKTQYNEVDVILCTYTLFERETNKHDRSFLSSQKFNYLVLDEAHCIKNPDSSRYANLNVIATQHRLLLSGTPVQNNVNELLALLSFLMPNMFRYDKCIAIMEALGWTNLKNNHQNSSLSQLKHMLAPFVLRRLKIDVLDQLSSKQTILNKVNMTERQKSIYLNILIGYAEQRKMKQLNYQAQSGAEVDLNNIVYVPRGSGDNPIAASDGVLDLTSPPSSHTTLNDPAALTGNKLCTKVHTIATTPIDLTESTPKKQEESIEIKEEDSHIVVTLTDLTPENEVVILEIKEQGQAIENTMTATEAKHLFTTLRKAANHPLLLRIYYNDKKVIDDIARVAHVHEHFGTQCDIKRVVEEIQSYSDFDLHQICVQYPEYLQKYELPADSLYDSPKMIYLRENLPRLQMEGHRMLIFSQWTRILDLLEVLLEDMDFKYLRLDGSTAVKVRQELIDTFNEDKTIPVFLLSTKAGGLGINLTSADTVILHDLDFNPENDKQAEDRCHRIGQTKPVTVYKLVAAGTVDEDIFELGEKKSELSKAVLSTSRGTKSNITPSKVNGVDEDGDITIISRILSKALLQHELVKT